VHLTLGILRKSQAVFYALSFFWLDGFAVPAPAQVTQTVGQPKSKLKAIFNWRELLYKNLCRIHKGIFMESVEKEFEDYVDKSRIVFWLPIILGICSGVLSEIKIVWVNLLSSVIYFFALIVFLTSLMYPGIFLIIGKPWFAQAWLRGINSFIIPAVSWKDLPVGKKIAVYFYSIVGFAFAILAIIAFIFNKGY
jgi:hypothetical protein